MKQETIYLAGGCFWGTEHYMKTLPGVLSTRVGYAFGKKAGEDRELPETVTYAEVCAHSGHAETVEVVFDADRITLPEILREYAYTIDPTTLGRQGMDIGIQYRTGIYSLTEKQRQTAADFLAELQKSYSQPVLVENLPLLQFIPAEEYHQAYLEKNPGGYCHINFAKIAKLKQQTVDAGQYQAKTTAELKECLTPMQFAVTQQNATEPPFENEFWKTTRKGLYVDITTGEPLFSSRDKFPSACGWPAFAKPIDPNTLTEYDDLSFGKS